MAWLLLHKYEIIPFLVIVVSSIATGLTNYPQAASWFSKIRVILDLISVLTHKDSQNTLKWPGSTSTPVKSAEPPAESPAEPPKAA